MKRIALFSAIATFVTLSLIASCSHEAVSEHAKQKIISSTNLLPESILKSGTVIAQKGAQTALAAGEKGLEFAKQEWFTHEPARAGAAAGFSAGCSQTKALLVSLPDHTKELAKTVLKANYKEYFDSLSPNVQKFLAAAPSLAKQKLDSLPEDVREFLGEFDSEVTAAFGNRPATQRPEFKAGYISGWIGWQAATVVICDRVLRLAAEGKAALSGDETARLAASRARYRRLCNHDGRIPESDGVWSGVKGESAWKSDLPEVKAITHGKTVEFRNGSPDFSPWSRGALKFNKGELNGSEQDFPVIYKKLAAEKSLSGESAAQDYLRNKGLTPHHVSETEIQLVPTAIHANIPHTGGAAFLRTEAK